MSVSDNKQDYSMEAGLLRTQGEERNMTAMMTKETKETLYQEPGTHQPRQAVRRVSPAGRALIAGLAVCGVLVFGIAAVGGVHGLCPGHLRHATPSEGVVMDHAIMNNSNPSLAKRQDGGSAVSPPQTSDAPTEPTDEATEEPTNDPTTNEPTNGGSSNDPSTSAAPPADTTSEAPPAESTKDDTPSTSNPPADDTTSAPATTSKAQEPSSTKESVPAETTTSEKESSQPAETTSSRRTTKAPEATTSESESQQETQTSSSDDEPSSSTAEPSGDDDETTATQTATESFAETITTGTRKTSKPVPVTLTSTRADGGVTLLTSTSWVAVVPSAEATSTDKDPSLQNAAPRSFSGVAASSALFGAFVGALFLVL